LPVSPIAAETVCFSRSNRSTLMPWASSGESTFTTTFRRSRVSSATKTFDIPPPPSLRSMV